MRNLLKKLLSKETLLYILFGVGTTVVNYLVFWVMIRVFGDRSALVSNVAAFIAAVTFAYITNKLFVFESKSWSREVLKREIPSFLGARLLSFVFEEVGLYVCLNVFHVERTQLFGIGGVMIAKIVLSVIVVIANYVFSKLWIFKPSDGGKEE